MKQLLLCLALLSPVVIAETPQAVATTIPGPTCPADSPCLYTGKAKTDDGYTLEISVYRADKYSTDLVAKFQVNSDTETAYVFPSGVGDGRWYLNWNGKKYWFDM